jgi:hypothetical protein
LLQTPRLLVERFQRLARLLMLRVSLELLLVALS